MIKFNVPYVSNHEITEIQKVISNQSFAGNNGYSKLCESYFEDTYGFYKCFLTPSCTAAIEMASLILDLKPNDEIIVPSYTFASCPNPFIIKGCKVVLADTDANYPNISIEHLNSLITSKTKAIMVMHYGGVGCNLNEIQALCKEKNIFLIEDAAQCLHAYYDEKPLGSFGDIGVFSFHETKNIHSGEGGMIVINNPALIEKAEIVRQYGTNKSDFLMNNLSHYESVGLGLALFQSEINAAFLYGQLNDIEKVTLNRKKLWNYYYKCLGSFSSDETFKLPFIDDNANSNAHTFFITLQNHNDTNQLIDYLKNKNIQAVKHFYPLHLSKFHSHNNISDSFSNTTNYNNTLIRLPLHHYLSTENIDFICAQIKMYFEIN